MYKSNHLHLNFRVGSSIHRNNGHLSKSEYSVFVLENIQILLMHSLQLLSSPTQLLHENLIKWIQSYGLYLYI